MCQYSSDRNNYLCTYDLYSPVHNVWMRAYALRGEVGNGYAHIQNIMHRAV